MEAIDKFFLEDGHIEKVCNFDRDEENSKNTVYEVVRVIDKIPLFQDEHILRLEKSFKILGKDFPYQNDKIKEFIKRLTEVNNIVNGNIMMTYNFDYGSIKIYSVEHEYPSKDMYSNGVKTISYETVRENPNAKIINESLIKKVTEELKIKKAYEAILIDEKGNITEGSKSNIFFVKENKVITSPIEYVLPGITREKVIELVKASNMELIERQVNINELTTITSMFLSSTSNKVLPISDVDSIKMDVEDPVIDTLMKKYNDEIELYINKYK